MEVLRARVAQHVKRVGSLTASDSYQHGLRGVASGLDNGDQRGARAQPRKE